MIPGARLPGLAECRDCHDPIRFVRMEATGRNMPVNPRPHHDDRPGVVAARLRGPALLGHVITLDHPGGALPYRFTPHYATCQHKSTTPPPTPEPADPALF